MPGKGLLFDYTITPSELLAVVEKNTEVARTLAGVLRVAMGYQNGGGDA